MPVAFDAVTTVATNDDLTTHTFNHTCTGATRALYVVVQTRSASVTHNAVSYGGTSLIKIEDANGVDGVAADDLYHSVWRLVAPSTGSNVVSVTLSAGNDAVLTAISFTGVNPTIPEGTILKAQSTNATTASLTVTSEVGGMVLDSLIVEGASSTPAVGADQDSRWSEANKNIENTADAVGSTQAGAASVEMSWTGISGFNDWTHIAIPIRPSALVPSTGFVLNKLRPRAFAPGLAR